MRESYRAFAVLLSVGCSWRDDKFDENLKRWRSIEKDWQKEKLFVAWRFQSEFEKLAAPIIWPKVPPYHQFMQSESKMKLYPCNSKVYGVFWRHPWVHDLNTWKNLEDPPCSRHSGELRSPKSWKHVDLGPTPTKTSRQCSSISQSLYEFATYTILRHYKRKLPLAFISCLTRRWSK